MASSSGPIAEYGTKRDFARTPEPPAAGAEAEIPAADGTFVIHRHEARRLHYDLRMATDRVLVCWAVPRGFSYDPAVKHLAVHTEDHPLRYRTFEGVIPKGEYGAGTMLIWDTGSYEVLKADDLAAAIDAGEVKVVLRGRRLRGEWHLVRTRAGQGGKDEWLLFKARDRYVRAADEPAPLVVDSARARPAPLPPRPRAMTAAADHEQFSDPDWLFELEFDGLRTLVAVVDGEVAFKRPTGAAAVIGRPIRAAVEGDFARIRASQALLDGVLVALDRHGRPARHALDSRHGRPAQHAPGGDAARRGSAQGAAMRGSTGDVATRANADDGAPADADSVRHEGRADSAAAAPAGTVAYYAFDLLHYDEWDLRGLRLAERKQFLRSLLPELPTVLYADHVTAGGEGLAAVAAGAGFHGLVAKRAASSYRPGAHSDAAHRRHHGIQCRDLLEQLQRQRALAGDDTRVAVGMDQRCALLGHDALGGGGARRIAVGAQLHARPVAGHGGPLHRGGAARHHHRGRHAAGARRGRHRLAVVARRVGHHAAAHLVGAELQHEVGGAAHLEGAHLLQVLRLEEQPGPALAVQPGAGEYRRAVHVRANPHASRADVGFRRQINNSAGARLPKHQVSANAQPPGISLSRGLQPQSKARCGSAATACASRSAIAMVSSSAVRSSAR